MNDLLKVLEKINACLEAQAWIAEEFKGKTWRACWLKCPRGDWLMWIAIMVGVSDTSIVKAYNKIVEVASAPGWCDSDQVVVVGGISLGGTTSSQIQEVRDVQGIRGLAATMRDILNEYYATFDDNGNTGQQWDTDLQNYAKIVRKHIPFKSVMDAWNEYSNRTD
jgi:hypothetical protein